LILTCVGSSPATPAIFSSLSSSLTVRLQPRRTHAQF